MFPHSTQYRHWMFQSAEVIHQQREATNRAFVARWGSQYIVYPGSLFLPIPDQQQKRGVKKIFCHIFLCSHKFHKIEHYFSHEVLKKKILANFQRIIELFTQKIVTKLSKIWLWDPGSEIRNPEKTYSRFRIQGSKRHRIPDLDPQHCTYSPTKIMRNLYVLKFASDEDSFLI